MCDYPDIIGDPDDPFRIEGELVDLMDKEQYNFFLGLYGAGKCSNDIERFNLIVQMISRDSNLNQIPH